MYKIMRTGRRFNTKSYPTYEEARKAVRRTVTKLLGGYADSFGSLGFSIQKIK
jgi:hypothetical protein